MKHEELTRKIIGVFYDIYNTLGYGFLEKVYENAMILELKKIGLKCQPQYPIKVNFRGNIVGEYIADILIEDLVIVEIKAIRELGIANESQLLNYLTATNKDIGLLFNYGKVPKFKRMIFEKARKRQL